MLVCCGPLARLLRPSPPLCSVAASSEAALLPLPFRDQKGSRATLEGVVSNYKGIVRGYRYVIREHRKARGSTEGGKGVTNKVYMLETGSKKSDSVMYTGFGLSGCRF